MISQKITSQVMELKSLVQRSMSTDDVERATRCCNGILAEADRVAALERETNLASEHGTAGSARLEAV